MLRSYIERQEHALYSRDNNRVPLPFEWGLEHLGLVSNGSPAAAFRDFVTQALDDSPCFYSYDRCDGYEFDGHLVKFPSALTTPYPENNTTWGRFFDGGRELGVVVLPQWNCKWDGQVDLCRLLQRSGISALRLSLPYHHQRKPPHLERSEYMVSPNVGRTLAASRQAVLDSRRAADWLFCLGHRRVGIVGTSIGSCIGFLTFAHDERFSVGIFIHVSGFFADVVWSGISTMHVRQSLEGAIELEDLRRLWSPISPFPFIPRLRRTNRRILALSGRYDLSFPPALSRQAYEEFDRCEVPYELEWLPCGHYTMGRLPFSAFVAYRVVTFLEGCRR